MTKISVNLGTIKPKNTKKSNVEKKSVSEQLLQSNNLTFKGSQTLRGIALAKPAFKGQEAVDKKPVYRTAPKGIKGLNGKKVILTILDGWGVSDRTNGNAIKLANTPTVDSLIKNNPSTTIHASGEQVGLPDGQMGNSEVGHLNLGAGRVIFQNLVKINNDIKSGKFFENPELLKTANHVKKNNSSLHIMGLVSPGGVHSSMDHLFATIDFAKKQGIEKVYVHAFLDGRDTPPKSAMENVKATNQKLKESNLPQIASVSGRFYAMDRDKRWERIEKAYDCLVNGEGIIGNSEC